MKITGEKDMGVERVDYYSEDEYQQALEQEQEQDSQPQEPEVVPCFKCGCQMYEMSNVPEENVCEDCSKQGVSPT